VTDGMKLIVKEAITNSSTQQKKGRVTVQHPVKDLDIYLIKSIERQSGLKFK
jgi:hypothetical protein